MKFLFINLIFIKKIIIKKNKTIKYKRTETSSKIHRSKNVDIDLQLKLYLVIVTSGVEMKRVCVFLVYLPFRTWCTSVIQQ